MACPPPLSPRETPLPGETPPPPGEIPPPQRPLRLGNSRGIFGRLPDFFGKFNQCVEVVGKPAKKMVTASSRTWYLTDGVREFIKNDSKCVLRLEVYYIGGM